MSDYKPLINPPFGYYASGWRVCTKAGPDPYMNLLESQMGGWYPTREAAQEVLTYFEDQGVYAYEIREGTFSLPPNITPEFLTTLLERVDYDASWVEKNK